MTKKTVRDELRATDTARLINELAMASPDRQTKISAELGRRGAKEAIKPLQSLLDSDVAEVRATAAEALGKIGNDRAGQALTRLLGDRAQPDFVRDTCAYALARIGYAPALPTLIDALSDRSESVQRCARSAIRAIVQSRDFQPEVLRYITNKFLCPAPNLPAEVLATDVPAMRTAVNHKAHAFGGVKYRKAYSLEKGIAVRRKLIAATSQHGSTAGRERARKLSASIKLPSLDSGLPI